MQVHRTPRKATRPATEAEVAAYKEAVKPLVGNAAAVYELRRRMHVYVQSHGIYIKTRH